MPWKPSQPATMSQVERVVLAVVPEADRGLVAGEAVETGRFRLEQDRHAAREIGRDQVLHHLLLAVDVDELAAGQAGQVEVDQLAGKADVERLVDHALAAQPGIDAEVGHQVDGALLQHAGAHAAFDVFAALRLKHHAIDAGALQQQREEQPRGTGADDADLRAHCSIKAPVPPLGQSVPSPLAGRAREGGRY